MEIGNHHRDTEGTEKREIWGQTPNSSLCPLCLCGGFRFLTMARSAKYVIAAGCVASDAAAAPPCGDARRGIWQPVIKLALESETKLRLKLTAQVRFSVDRTEGGIGDRQGGGVWLRMIQYVPCVQAELQRLRLADPECFL
jgi:hypothetical protein